MKLNSACSRAGEGLFFLLSFSLSPICVFGRNPTCSGTLSTQPMCYGDMNSCAFLCLCCLLFFNAYTLPFLAVKHLYFLSQFIFLMLFLLRNGILKVEKKKKKQRRGRKKPEGLAVSRLTLHRSCMSCGDSWVLSCPLVF